MKNTISDKELIKLCLGFKKGLLGTKHAPKGSCFIVSAPLEGYLSFLGVKCKLEMSTVKKPYRTNHSYIRLEDTRVLDPTLDQFSGSDQYPTIYLGPGLKDFHTKER